MLKLLGVVALVTIGFVAEAAAQVYVPAPIVVPAPTDFSNILIQREIGRTAAKRLGGGNVAKSPTASLARRMPSIYEPYLANIGRVWILQKGARLEPGGQGTVFHASQPPFVPQQLAERLGKTKQERQDIEGILTECLKFYSDTAKQKGMPLNDVARALNYFISANYFVYSSGAGPTPEQMRATRDSIRASMVQDDAFQRMSDKQKQEAYETLIVLAGVVDLGTGTARKNGDTNAAAQFREIAKRNLEALLGAPVGKIYFAKDGLALK